MVPDTEGSFLEGRAYHIVAACITDNQNNFQYHWKDFQKLPGKDASQQFSGYIFYFHACNYTEQILWKTTETNSLRIEKMLSLAKL